MYWGVPFGAHKKEPLTELEKEMHEAVSSRLIKARDVIRAAGVEPGSSGGRAARASLPPVKMSDQELELYIRMFEGVRLECADDIYELKVHVGPPDAVRACLAKLKSHRTKTEA